MMDNVLITGATGYLGRHFVTRLRKNYQVYSLSKSLTEPDTKLNFKLDLRQPIPAEIEIKSPIVIHTAAVKPSLSTTEDMIHSNILGTFNTLEWAIKNKASKFIYFSTGSVYGYKQNYHHQEGDALNPIGAYGHSKYLGENLVETYHKIYNLPVIIIRLFYPYGANQDTGIFSIIKNKILNNQTIKLDGNGCQKINPIHIDDCVDAVALLLKKTFNFQIYNLCGSDEVSFIELVRLYEHHLQQSALIQMTDNKAFDLLGSNIKIKQTLNWEQKRSIYHSNEFALT
jgi:dTDP-glucose 4,6-dehydratase